MNNDSERELLTLRNVSLEPEGIPVLRDANYSFAPHQGYLITGPDETANVFLLKTIAGILPYGDHSGQILFKGRDIYNTMEQELKEIKRQMAFIFREGTMISNLTIKENLLLPIQYHQPDHDIASVIGKIKEGLDYFRVPDVLDRRPESLSYSVNKKLSFIRASLREPEMIMIDKPMFNLDDRDREQVAEYLEGLKNKGVTLVMISHSPSLLKGLVDETIILEGGELKREEQGTKEQGV
ncbi:MAG: ATP-binding cassette domain-containing protein [bacterium]|nr:ATP-binding cassette domain-containing protein [bacterium]